MSCDDKHPLYNDYIDEWIMLRDCASGERAVKLKDQTYLPMPSGFTVQDDKGVAMYIAYQKRAQYPDILQPTMQGMVGVIHRIEAQIEGLDEGKPLAYMWEKATNDGLTLEAFHRMITSEILLAGRYSILTDVPSGEKGGTKGQPYFTGYSAEQLINWSDPKRDLFVLDETRYERGNEAPTEETKTESTSAGNQPTPKKTEEEEKTPVVDEFTWTEQLKYRVLRLKNGVYTAQTYNRSSFLEDEEITPQVQGGKKLEEIPLVVVGPRLVSLGLEPSPLVGVAKAALAIFRLDADYRHQLFWSGQETLFIISSNVENLPKILGAGAVYGLPEGSTATYVGPSGVGINAHRQAILDERQNAVAAGVKLFDSQKAAESGEALRLRAAAQTATLTTIALASAAALEKSLRYAAMFVGQDPTEIVVKPNLDFVENRMTAQEANQLVSVWQSGAISKQTLYEDLQRGEIASAERTFEEEQDLINQEAIDQPMIPGMQAAPGGPMPPGFGGPGAAAPPGMAGRLNGSEALAQGGAIPERFIETGEGLTIEPA